jgi:hypothetical protein
MNVKFGDWTLVQLAAAAGADPPIQMVSSTMPTPRKTRMVGGRV